MTYLHDYNPHPKQQRQRPTERTDQHSRPKPQHTAQRDLLHSCGVDVLRVLCKRGLRIPGMGVGW
jgi:hypothetical protein